MFRKLDVLPIQQQICMIAYYPYELPFFLENNDAYMNYYGW